MKKLSTTLERNDDNYPRSSYSSFLFKVLSSAAIVAFLANVSPVFSASSDLTKVLLNSGESAAEEDANSSASLLNVLNVAKKNSLTAQNYLTALNMGPISEVDASVDYANFLIKTLSGKSDNSSIINILTAEDNNLSKGVISTEEPYKRSLTNRQLPISDSSTVQQFAYNSKNAIPVTMPVNVSDLLRDGTTRLSSGVDGTNVVFGNNITTGSDLFARSDIVAIGAKIIIRAEDSVAVGYGAQTDKSVTVAIGHLAYAMGEKSIAIGGEGRRGDNPIPPEGRTIAKGEESIAIGRRSRADNLASVTLGAHSKAVVDSGVALGSESVTKRAAGVPGYTSMLQGPATNELSYWKSTLGAVSVGDADNGKTRQITGVAAGSEDPDAVNVAQLKALQAYVDKGWNVSVGGANATAVSVNKTLDFSAESSNLNITKGKEDNKVKFDLAQDVTLTSLKAGENSLDATGLVITGGPKITTAGIDVSNKELKGVKAGDLSAQSTEAVNGSQLFATNSDVTKNTNALTEANIKISKNATDITTANNNVSSLGKNISKYLGEDVDVLQGKGPTYTVQGQTYNNVASAFDGVNTSFKNVDNEINEVKENLLVQQEEEQKLLRNDKVDGKGTGVITIGKNTGGWKISLLNKDSKERKLTGLLGGDLSINSNEAVSGGQINILGGKVAAFFGGGADFGNGNWNGPTFQIKTVKENGAEEDESYHDVASAFAGVGTSLTNLHKEVKNEITKVEGENLVKQEEGGGRITVGAGKGGSEISIADSKSADRTLSGVKAATQDNEAVNKGQLDTNIKEASEKITNEFKEFTQNITNITQEVKGDALLWSEGDNAFVAQHGEDSEDKAKTNSKIKFLADGEISASSTEAINGSQINTLSQNIASFLGGDAKFSDGAFTGPSYKLSTISSEGKVGKTEFKDVGKAFSGLDTNIQNVNKRIKEVSQGVAQDSLLWSENDKAFIADHGKNDAKTKSKITHLLDGNVVSGSTDAITGGQLYSMGETVAQYFGGGAGYTGGEWKAPSFKVKTFKDDGNSEDKSYTTVAEALAGVGSSITNVQNKVTNDITKQVNNAITKVEGDNLVKQADGDTGRITIGGEKGGNEISIADSKSADRTLSGVKAATQDNEAVNKGQLDTNIKEASEKITNEFKDFTQNITNITQEVKGDALLWSESDNAFVAQHGEDKAKTNSKIKFLADGEISASSTEAVNGSQLHTFGGSIATYLGGDAKYENGQWTAPTFKVKQIDSDGDITDESYKNVADAFSSVGHSFKSIYDEINTMISDSLVKQEDKTNRITIGAEKDGAEISIVNKSKEDRILSGVKAAVNSNEAVNKGQLDESLKELSNNLQSDDSAVKLKINSRMLRMKLPKRLQTRKVTL
ncbi:hypothetical protein [Bartonella sp. OC73QHHN]|uniref:hypothetical protein n=1 Tax=Bartonella sp. OC73QHHN TaxID=3243569 RepID=UPI0035D1178C